MLLINGFVLFLETGPYLEFEAVFDCQLIKLIMEYGTNFEALFRASIYGSPQDVEDQIHKWNSGHGCTSDVRNRLRNETVKLEFSAIFF